MNKFILEYSRYIVAFALMISAHSVNTVCALYFNQPKVPDSVKKLRKF